MGVLIDLAQKTALVTGASQGIGAAIARRLHEAGASVVLNHPDVGTSGADAEALASELGASRPGSGLVLAADVRDPGAVRAMMDRVRQDRGGLDILVNNAGILRDRTIAKLALEDWQAVIDVNLNGVFHCCKFGLEILRDGGSIVNLGSIAALMGFPGQANYAASKAGVLAMTRVLSRECARRSIRVNAVAPGVVETPMAAQIREDVRTGMLTQIPLGRFAHPREIADAVLFLSSPLASYITGQTIEVNGGWR
jgi:3-oxoacyl-[acyl-carrier protein] reductase